MAYKNTSGNESIASRFSNWQYFNSNLQKLSRQRPANVSIQVPKASDLMREQVDWMKSLRGGFNALMEAKQKRDEKVAQEAYEYINTHSLEEYNKAIKENNVPFQDDPVAMHVYKEGIGEITGKMAHQDFLDRVNTNEFQGKTNVEVDAAFYEASNTALNEVAKTYGIDPNDASLRRGFFKDSDVRRLDTINKKNIVEDDELKQQSIIQETAKFAELANNPNTTIDDVKRRIYRVMHTTGVHYEPREVASLLNGFLSSASKTPTGYKILDGMRNEKIPNTNVTFEEYIGKDQYEAMRIRSLNHEQLKNNREHLKWTFGIYDLSNEGKVSRLEYLLQQEHDFNGKVETARTKVLEAGILRAKKAQEQAREAAIKAHQKEEEDNIKRLDAVQYILQGANGDKMVPLEVFGSGRATSKTLKQTYQPLVKAGYISWEQQKALAANTTVPSNNNMARQYFNESFDMAMSKVNGWVDAFNNNQSNLLPKSDADIPQEVTMMLQLWQEEPEKFRLMVDDPSDEDMMKFQAISNLMTSGKPLRDIIGGLANFNRLRDSKEGRYIISEINDKATSEMMMDVGIGSKKPLDNVGQTYIRNSTQIYMSYGADSREAYKKAKEDFEKTHFNFLGATVPTYFLRKNDKSSQHNFSNYINGLLERNNLKKEDVIVSFSPYTKTVTLSLYTGELVKRITPNDAIEYQKQAALKEMKSNQSWYTKVFGESSKYDYEYKWDGVSEEGRTD